MSIKYRIDNEAGITYIRWNGVVSGDEFLAFLRTLTSDPDWPPKRRLQLCDLRYVSDDGSIDNGTLEKAAEIFANDLDKLVGYKAAIVAKEEFAKATRFQNLMSQFGPTMIVFNSMDIACSWLGIDVNEAERKFWQLGDSAEL